MNNNFAVIIPSANRPVILRRTLRALLRQSEPPAEIIVSIPGPEHVLPECASMPRVKLIQSEMGAARQRNRAIAALGPDIELVALLDDDVALRDDYLAAFSLVFRARPDIVLLRGHMVANGMQGGPIEPEDAEAMIAEDARTHAGAAAALHLVPITCIDAFGAALAVRRSVLRHARFDERLPLYSYAEDLDFAQQCAAYGGLAYCFNARLVHLYAPGGRLPGACIGFAQVMNLAYLQRKGTCPTAFCVSRVLRHVASNMVSLLDRRPSAPERGARLRGNLRALGFLLQGRIEPEEMEAMARRAGSGGSAPRLQAGSVASRN